MISDSSPVPLTETSLADYFRQRLAECAQRLKPPPHEDTRWYLGTLLVRFSQAEHLFGYANGQLDLQPLALVYGDALQAGSRHERCMLLQRLGDMALVLGALFPGHYAKRGIQRDYFIGMGGGAYDYLAEHARHHRHVYAELARTFSRMLELVANACSRTEQPGTGDILALYQRWLRSRDPLAEKQLRALGIALGESERIQ